jgi:diguanylate cyclase (GGDEF)-like protein
VSEAQGSGLLLRPATGEARALRLALLAGVGFIVASVAWDFFFEPDFATRLLPVRAVGVALFGGVAALTFALPHRALALGAVAHALGAAVICVAAAILPYGYGYGAGGMLLGALATALAFRDGRSSAIVGCAALIGAAVALGVMRVPLDTALAIAFFAVPGTVTASLVAHSTGLRLDRERSVRATLAALQEDLARFGAQDALTGVPDGKQLTSLARREISLARRRSSALSALKIDVDRLELINTRFGRQAGDETLRAVASMCQAALRESDLLARIGGDDFVAVLPEADAAGAQTICERVRTSLQKAKVLAGDQVVQVSVCVAATTLSPDDKNLDDMLKRADEELARQKANSSNPPVTSPPSSDA